jgi:hypothetical protein
MLLPLFTFLTVLCAFLAWRADEALVRWVFIGFTVLNIVAGAVAVASGDAWKWMPDDGVAEPAYRK